MRRVWLRSRWELLVPCALVLVQAARLAKLLRLPDRLLVTYLPDDAFYYLALAQNFARTGRWTFDGVEPATGFHLLWAYLLAALYKMAPHLTLHGVLLWGGVFQTLCLALAAWLVVRTAEHVFNEHAEALSAGVGLIFLSSISLVIDTSLMESPLLILASAATLWLLCRAEPPRGWGLGRAFALGLAGMLARSDFGLLPLVLLLMQSVLRRRQLASARMTRLAAAVLAGSVAGLAIILLHTHWISGNWLQSSAVVKARWARLFGDTFAHVGRLLYNLFSPAYSEGLVSHRVERLSEVCVCTVLALLLVGLSRIMRRLPPGRRWMVGGLATIIAAYAVLYRFNSAAVYSWYIQSFEAPVALLAGGAGMWLFRHRHVWAGSALCALLAWHIAGSLQPQTPYQNALWAGGRYIAQHSELRPVGAWNAGIINYFAGGGVTNLDGLVNDSVLQPQRNGTLAQYIEHRKLHTIVDFSGQFTPIPALGAGISNGELQRCVVEVNFLAGDPDVAKSNRVMLYRIKPECIHP